MKALLPLGLVFTLVITGHSVKSQQPPTQPTIPRDKKDKAEPRESLDEVLSLQNRILAFENSEAKIRTMILLADLVWSKPKNQPSARALFQKAEELVRSARVAKPTESRGSKGNKRDGSVLTPAVYNSLKELLVQRVSVRDIAWGQRLRREFELGPERKAIESSEVSTQLRDGLALTAANSLHQMIEQNLSGRRALMDFMQLLVRLRAQDAPAADKLFIEAAAKMAQQPNTAANDVLILGNYIFASRFMAPDEFNAPRFTTSPIQLGDVFVRADVTQARPNLSPALARPYLAAATQSIEQPTFDVEEMQVRSAAAYLLLPHARTFAPELTTRLASTVQRADVGLTEPSQPFRLPKQKSGELDLDSIMDSVAAIPNSLERDQFILRVVRQLYFAKEFDAATRVTEKMSDEKARAQLLSVVAFGQGVKALESEQMDRTALTQKRLDGITSNLQRFLLRIGVAQAFLKQQDKESAATILNQSIDEFGKHTIGGQQPYLILSAVELLASADQSGATYRMRDVIKSFNALDPSLKEQANLIEIVQIGNVSASFPLRISGFKSGSFSSTVKSLSSERQTLRAILFDLRDEKVLSEAMLAYAGALLG